MRHLATADLWVQQKVRGRELKLYKLLGKENPSDVLTKYKTAPEASRFMSMLGIRSIAGRPQISPSRVVSVSSECSEGVAELSRKTSRAPQETVTSSLY